MLLAAACFSSCEKFLTTEPSDQVSDASALSSTAQLQMSLISAYNQMFFNSSGGHDRLFGGLYGLQLTAMDLIDPKRRILEGIVAADADGQLGHLLVLVGFGAV